MSDCESKRCAGIRKTLSECADRAIALERRHSALKDAVRKEQAARLESAMKGCVCFGRVNCAPCDALIGAREAVRALLASEPTP